MIVLGEVATGMGVAKYLGNSGANLNQIRHTILIDLMIESCIADENH